MKIPREYNAATLVLQDRKDLTVTCRLGSGPWVPCAVDGA